MDDNVLKFPSFGDPMADLVAVPQDLPEGSQGNVPVKVVYDGLTNILPSLQTLIVIGADTEGRFFFASSELKKSDILYDLKTAEYSLMMEEF